MRDDRHRRATCPPVVTTARQVGTPHSPVTLEGGPKPGDDDVDFHRVNLHRVNLHRVNLHRVNLHRVNLHRVNLHRVNLQGVDSHRVNLHRIGVERLDDHAPHTGVSDGDIRCRGREGSDQPGHPHAHGLGDSVHFGCAGGQAGGRGRRRIRRVEIFEPDFVASSWSAAQVRHRCADLGLSIDLYQPFRDFDSARPEMLQANLRRADRKFDVMQRLGTDLILVCSSVAPDALDDDDRIAEQLHQLATRAHDRGLRVSYEALAWAGSAASHELILGISRPTRRPPGARPVHRQLPHTVPRFGSGGHRADPRRQAVLPAAGRRALPEHGCPAVEPALPIVSGPGHVRPAGVPRPRLAAGYTGPSRRRGVQRRLPAVRTPAGRGGCAAVAARAAGIHPRSIAVTGQRRGRIRHRRLRGTRVVSRRAVGRCRRAGTRDRAPGAGAGRFRVRRARRRRRQPTGGRRGASGIRIPPLRATPDQTGAALAAGRGPGAAELLAGRSAVDRGRGGRAGRRDGGPGQRRTPGAQALLAPVLPRRKGPAEADLAAVAAPDGTSVFFCRTGA